MNSVRGEAYDFDTGSPRAAAVGESDPETAASVMTLLLDICREERLTVIASLHQVEVARGWADRLVGLREGRVVLDASPRDITSDQVMAIYRGARRAAGAQASSAAVIG